MIRCISFREGAMGKGRHPFLLASQRKRKEGPPDCRLTKLSSNKKAVFNCLSETADSSYEYQGGSNRIAYRYLSLVREAKVSADMEAILLFRRNLQQIQSRYLFKTVKSLLSGHPLNPFW